MSDSSVFHTVLMALTGLTVEEKSIVRAILAHDSAEEPPRNSSYRDPDRQTGEPGILDPSQIAKVYAMLRLPPFFLTPRELEVLECLALGYKNKDVARRLNISPRTVEVHRSRVMRKLGAKSPVNLAEILGTMSRGRLADALMGRPALRA